MTHLLTADMLRSKTACEKQVMMFESEWPNGMPLDESVVPRIVDLKLSVNWFAMRFLETAVWDEYLRAKSSARSEYFRVEAHARSEYNSVEAAAWDEYNRVEAAAWTKYERVKATAAIRLYREQESK